ncbi:MAG: phosphoribosylglycinamide formyltransferase [Gemmatales bacterium]
MAKLRLAVLLSAGGTTLQNLIDRIAQGRLNAEIAAVISSRPDVYGLVRAAQAGLPHEVIARKGKTREQFGEAMYGRLRDVKPDLVCLAGFLEFLPIPPDFTHKVINIHPSLIPAFCGKGFYGRHVHEAALKAGVKVTGCTVHFADNEFDHGPIILQRAVPVLDDDTAETLGQRVFQAECEAFPEAIELIAAGRVQIQDHRVHVQPR